MANPYLMQPPCLISFSGGRTSAYMLHEILRAHDGKLADDVFVVFANTGKEREETLRFVYECGSRWAVDIVWLEWRDAKPCFERVGYNSAARNGEPFSALIAKKKRLPNWMERWCTEYLKVRVMTAFAQSIGLGAGRYTEVIGLRDDEGHRIFKGMENADKYGRKVAYPLARAKVTKQDVLAFWRSQPFDLALRGWEGNCDLCFLKGRVLRKRIIRDNPCCAVWWHEHEQATGGWFDKRDRIEALTTEVSATPELIGLDGDDEHDTECGLYCGGG